MEGTCERSGARRTLNRAYSSIIIKGFMNGENERKLMGLGKIREKKVVQRFKKLKTR